MRFTNIIVLIFLFIVPLFLSNCSSLDDLEASYDDFESIFDDTEESNPKNSSLPIKKFDPFIIKAKPLEKPKKVQKQEIINKINPIPTKTEEKEIEKIQEEIALIDINKCRQDLFLLPKNISNLYRVYIKSNNKCLKIDNPKAKKHFINVLIQHYSSQDIRILNADEKFMALYATAVKNSDNTDKLRLNKQIIDYGCHLLNANTCGIFKRSLY